MSDNTFTTLKIIVFGSCSVGKTSILTQLLENKFTDVRSTIGVDYRIKKYNYDGKIINLALWDTAGMERFHSLPSTLYRDVQGAVLVYDVTNYQSFRELHRWISDLHAFFEGLEKQPVVIVLGNKIDLDGREVQRKEGLDFAKRHRALFLETSAKTRVGVDTAFDDLVTKILETPGLWKSNMGSVVALHQQQNPSTVWYNNCNQC